MKAFAPGLLLTFSLALSTWAVASPSDDVIAAELSRGRALLTGDATALAAVTANDLVYIHSTGKRESKADTLAGIRSGKVAYERFVQSQLNVHLVTPDVAVLTGTIDQRKLGSGKWADLKLLFHAVWRRESGGWKLVGLQTVQPPAPRT